MIKMFTKFEHKSIKVTLNKKSKKKYFFEYSKKYFTQKSTFLSTQKITLLKKVFKKLFFLHNGSNKYFFEYLKNYFCSSTFLILKKVLCSKKYSKRPQKSTFTQKLLLLKKVNVLKKYFFPEKNN